MRRIREISEKRKRRGIFGAMFVSLSLVLMEIAVLILLGIIALSPIVAVVLIILSPISMALGLYLLLFMPPITLD